MTKRQNFTPLPEPIPLTEHYWPEGTVPLVTTRTMTYMHKAFIRDCIEGILMQRTTFPVQVLIHDDASTDGTADIVRSYQEKYPEIIRTFYQPVNTYKDPNHLELRSEFFRWVTGKYVALCEGDDYWTDPLKLQKQVCFLEENPDYAIAFHNAVVLYREGNSWKPKHRYNDFNWCNIDFSRKTYDGHDFLSDLHPPTPSVVYRRPPDLIQPDWMLSVPSGDIPLFSMVLGENKARFFDWEGSVYRKHLGGVSATHRGDYIHVGRIVTYLGLLVYHKGAYAGIIASTIGNHLRELENFDSLRKHPYSKKLLQEIKPYIAELEEGHSFREVYHELDALLGERPFLHLTSDAVFVMHGPNQLNGPNVWLTRLLPELVRRGLRITVLVVTHEDQRCRISQTLKTAGVRVETLKPLHTEDSVRQILEYLNQHPTKVFVPNLNVPSYFASCWVKSSGIPTIGVLHSDDDFHHDLEDEFIVGKQGSYLSACVVVSKQQKDYLNNLDAKGTEIVLAPYGAPIPKRSCHYSKKPFRCIYVGRLRDQQKRVTDMVKGMLGVMRQYPEIEFHLCGEGDARPQLEKLIAREGMTDRLLLHGNLSQDAVRDLSLECQVFLLLSDYEGIPIALMEAMACGLVPICSDIRSGIPELVTHDKEGLIVKDRGAELKEAMGRLIDDPALWQRMSKAAQAKINPAYSSDNNTEIWVNLLQRLVEKNPQERKKIRLPQVFDLPPKRTNPLGIAREDHRKPTPESAFTSPNQIPNNADLYWQRQSILNAIQSAKPLLNGVFLDVGCGIMPYKKLLTGDGSLITRYLGLDIETETYRADVDLRWDGRTIPLANASIDSAMATEVLEHCPEPLVVLREIRRVLKPGGVFFFTVPYIWPLHDAPYDFYRYTPFSLKKLLAEAGFDDSDVKALSGWDASLAQMMGLWLKRAPMSNERRNAMTKKLWPLYQELVQTDQLPADSEAGNTMATGWRGVTFAKSDCVDAPAAQAVMPMDLPLLIVRSHEKNYSETFIQDHVDYLSRQTTVLHGWPFPRFVGNQSVLKSADELALQQALFRGQGISAELSRSYTTAVGEWLKTSGVRVALMESGVMGAFLHQACEIAKVPYVVHFHGVDAWKKDLLQQWQPQYQKFLKQANGIIGVSKEMVRQLEQLGADPNRLHHGPYGVEIAVERLANPATAAPSFLAVGRFVDKKAPLKTLQAFQLMWRKVPEARLIMVGDGPLLRDCQLWVEQQGMSDAVTFAGVLRRRAVSRLMSTARVFLQHSVVAEDGDREGLPLAVLEAGAHGLPLVATRHAGIPDAVREGEDGFLVDEGDVEEMALAMSKLATEADLAGRMGSSFRKRVEAEYSREISIERLQSLLQKVASAQETPSSHALSSMSTPAPETPEERIAQDRNYGEALVQIGSHAATQGAYEKAYLYLKEAQRVGALPQSAEPIVQSLETNPQLQTEIVRSYQECIGMGGFGKSEQPRRILVFTNLLPPQEMGGFGRTVWEFCDGLLQRGHDVRILTADVPELYQPPPTGYERVEQQVKRTLQLFGYWKNGEARLSDDESEIRRIALNNVKVILAEVKSFRPDICMAGNLDFLGGMMLDPILKQGIPIVHRLGNIATGYTAAETPRSDLYCIAGCSNWVNQELQKNGFHAKHFVVLPAGAPLHQYFRLVPPAFDYLRICYAGMVMNYKGPHLLIQALGILKKLGVRFTCEIAGDLKDPHYFKQLEALVANNGIENQVRALGFQDRNGLGAMFARNNTLVFPSVFEEPFGKVQIEAQAAGLAVVRSAVGGYADMMEDGVNGLLFKPNDAEDLARQLFALQGNKELWQRVAAQGQVDAYRFTTKNSVQILEEIFDALLIRADAG